MSKIREREQASRLDKAIAETERFLDAAVELKLQLQEKPASPPCRANAAAKRASHDMTAAVIAWRNGGRR